MILVGYAYYRVGVSFAPFSLCQGELDPHRFYRSPHILTIILTFFVFQDPLLFEAVDGPATPLTSAAAGEVCVVTPFL